MFSSNIYSFLLKKCYIRVSHKRMETFFSLYNFELKQLLRVKVFVKINNLCYKNKITNSVKEKCFSDLTVPKT